MFDSLLTTKLEPPRHPGGLLPRQRLTETLDLQVHEHRLTLVSAPAGYGKTTLLADWARTSRKQLGWLSLTEDDNELVRFLRYLILAWEQVQPDIIESRLGILLGSAAVDPKTALSAFINHASELRDHQVLILDDYHLIHDRAIHDSMAFLVNHLPRHLHFVLGARSNPPLPLARYRARGQLREFGAEELRFDLNEASGFLSRIMGLELEEEEIRHLHSQVEGWAAGLQLAGLNLRQARKGERPESTITGRQRFVADYLKHDVLEHLSEGVRNFLLRTSILDRLSADLCNALSAGKAGQEMLERLERENLFVHRLDDERRWFRYHRLFAEYLQAELESRTPERIPELHRRAARWFLANGLPEQAFRHALEGKDASLVTQIVDRSLPEMINRGDLTTVGRWLSALPEQWYADHPALALSRVAFLGVMGAFGESARLLEEVEQRLAGAEDPEWHRLMARATAFRCALACTQNDLARAERFGDRAARDLPEDDLFYHELINIALGDTYRQLGRWEDARLRYEQALRLSEGYPGPSRSVHALGALADLSLKRGQLGQAAALWERALSVIEARENWGSLQLPVVGWVFVRLAEILYERNHRTEARDMLARGLDHVELGGDVRGMIAGYLIGGRMMLTEGDAESAGAYLERARPMVEQAQLPEWTSRFERLQLELWLAQDKLRAAVDWADEMLRDGTLDDRQESELLQLAVARVLIVKMDAASLERAGDLLVRLLESAQEQGRAAVEIEALGLQALSRWRAGDLAGALTSLERSLRAASPEGYIRRFVDLGPPMARLLQEAQSRSVMVEYVDELLHAFSGDARSSAHQIESLPEPLTPREQEVLELIAAGLMNREIADQLVISPETVKKHAGNIYAKLHVSNRTQAVAKGRELQLLA